MFANILSGMLSFRFILPIIALLSAGGYGYYMHSNKGSLKSQLEVANARIASFNSEIEKAKDALDDKNNVIEMLEKEIERKSKIHVVTQEKINDLSSKNAALYASRRFALNQLDELQSKYKNHECFNEIIPNDVRDVINGGVRIDTDNRGG